MAGYATRDVILLHLLGVDAVRDGDPSRVGHICSTVCTIAGTTQERLSILSILSDLEAEGLVETRALSDRQVGYVLTDEGEVVAKEIVEDISSDTVTLKTGDGQVKTTLAAADDRLDQPQLARAAARVSHDNVLSLAGTDEIVCVGREQEIEQVEQEAEKAITNGDTQVVFASGDSGIGKGMVADAVATNLERRGWKIIRGRFSSGTPEPFKTIRDAFDEHLDDGCLTFDDRSFGGGIESAEDLEARKRIVFDECGDTISQSDSLIALMLEDCQYIDQDTVDLLAHLNNTGVDHPLFIYCSGRTFDEDVFLEFGSYSTVEFEPFDIYDTRNLVSQAIGEVSVDEKFASEIHRISCGNPFHIVQTIAYLIDEGYIDPSTGEYPGAIEGGGVLSDIESLLSERLGSLPTGVLEVLQLGAILGGHFHVDVVCSILDMDGYELDEILQVLTDAGFVDRLSDDEFCISTLSYRERLIEGMDKEALTAYHRQIVDIADGWGSEDAGSRGGVSGIQLADHLVEAGQFERAVKEYTTVAEASKSRYAYDVALTNFDRAHEIVQRELDYAPHDPYVIDKLKELGDINRLLGNEDVAIDQLSRVWEECVDDETRQWVAVRMANLKMDLGEYDEVIEWGEKGIECSDNGEYTAQLHNYIGWARLRRGERDTAEQMFLKAKQLAKENDDSSSVQEAIDMLARLKTHPLDCALGRHRVWARRIHDEAKEMDDVSSGVGGAYGNIGTLHYERGEYEEAIEQYQETVNIIQRSNEISERFYILNDLAGLYRMQGDFQTAIENIRRAGRLAYERGNDHAVAVFRANLGLLYHEMGRVGKAADVLREAYDQLIGAGDELCRARVGLMYAKVLTEVGYTNRAEKIVDDSLAIAEDIGSEYVQSLAHAQKGNILRIVEGGSVAAGHHRQALTVAEEYDTDGVILNRLGLVKDFVAMGRGEQATEQLTKIRESIDCNTPIETVIVNRWEAEVQRVLNNQNRARQAIERAREVEGQIGSSLYQARIAYTRGRVERSGGEEDTARQYFEECRDIAENGGMKRLIGLCDDAIDRIEDTEKAV